MQSPVIPTHTVVAPDFQGTELTDDTFDASAESAVLRGQGFPTAVASRRRWFQTNALRQALSGVPFSEAFDTSEDFDV